MLHLDMSIIYTLVNMLLLYALFRIFLFKPLNRVLDQRRATVQSSLDKAEDSARQAAALERQYQEKIQLAQGEAEDIIRQAKEQAAQIRQQMQKQTQEEIEQQKEKFRRQMALERETAMKESRGEIAMLAMLAAAKILGRELDSDQDQDNDQIIQQLIQEAGEKR